MARPKNNPHLITVEVNVKQIDRGVGHVTASIQFGGLFADSLEKAATAFNLSPVELAMVQIETSHLIAPQLGFGVSSKQ